MYNIFTWTNIIILFIIHFHRVGLCEGRSSFDKMLMPPYQRNTHRKPTRTDSDKDGLNKGYFRVVDGISTGLELAVEECKHQFFWDLWNCPVSASTIISKSANSKGTREVSFLQAVSAAGIVYSVTKTCNRKDNTLCGCGSGGKDYLSTGTLNWKWGGCSHNVKFGEKVAKLFLMTETAATNIEQVIKSHNERAGHRAIKRTMKTLCKCHGPTGSCTMRTCWKTLSEFRVVGALLRKKYKRSKDIRHMQGFTHNSNKVSHPKVTRISKHDLVHFEDSPNYCETDNSIGYLGTLGRECLKLEKSANKTSMKKFLRNSCRRLCKNCGHKVARVVYEDIYKCDCEFKWCCSVDCKMCKKKVSKYYCK
ncbi:protein Wnt-8b-like [Mercenaria mercenaria]|uniref:protein Wnt-8b-like n=1 Tax=Mercenaria mercenaria TaxID=6596 RepID=UPI00234EF2A7|nr:protein Wnt-8b-like [Mercenaria mercenaria]